MRILFLKAPKNMAAEALTACAMLWGTAGMCAAEAPDSTIVSEPQVKVSLVTAAPGSEIYQLEGHSALRLRKPGDYDVAVNWGVFNFAAPNFVWRFVKGETDYMAAAYDFRIFEDEYRREGRLLTEQVLNLTDEQTNRLLDLISTNLLPENRTYRYNYVRDNCATHPFNLIQQAVGAPVAVDSAFVEEVQHSFPDATFRSEMQRYHSSYPWYQFGIDLALGSGLDIPISVNQRAFSPVFLCDMVARTSIVQPDGSLKPLAEKAVVILPGKAGGTALGPTRWFLTPVAVSLLLLAITLALSFADFRRRHISRWFDSILYGIFFLEGCLLTFLIFVSVHEATSPNWLYLWLNPLCIIPAAGIWIKRCRKVVYCYQICNFAALILLLAAHRFFGQALNAAFPILIACDLIRSVTYILLYRKDRKPYPAQSGAKN